MLDKEFYTTKEIIKLFGINRQTLHRWRKKELFNTKILGKENSFTKTRYWKNFLIMKVNLLPQTRKTLFIVEYQI